ncbi:MAG: acetyltransferase [Bacteroidetes bacterium]|nr:acetyltransferase [Bacteroidota bacterium]
MKSKDDIVLVGGGGHCASVIDVIEQSNQYKIIGIVDKQENVGKDIVGYSFIGSDADLPKLVKEFRNFVITVGHIKSNETRTRLYDLVKSLGGFFPSIFSPSAYVSKHSFIGEGTVIMHNAFVNVSVRIGKNSIVNTGSIIEHDSVIGDHCHISTGAVINGGCQIGEHSFIGSNAMIRQYLTIGHHVSVGASSVVMKDLESNGLYIGNPVVLKSKG